MALKMVLHAIRMIFRDFSGTMRVTLGPFLLSQVVLFSGFYFAFGEMDVLNGNEAEALNDFTASGLGISMLLILIAIVISVILTTWMAVAWHRFVLLGERPVVFPNYPKGKVGSYFWLGLIISILIGVPIAVVIMFLALMFQDPLVLAIVGILAVLCGVFFFLRISMGLPALCIDKTIRIGESFEETKPMASTIFGVAVIVAVIFGITTAVAESLFGSSIIVTSLFNWFTTLLMLSVLTTIFGVCIEGRTLT